MIFVCIVTKAIHSESVKDVTSDAFITTLKRLFKRGKLSFNITDNATEFKGAKSELCKLHDLARKPDEKISNYLSSRSY